MAAATGRLAVATCHSRSISAWNSGPCGRTWPAALAAVTTHSKSRPSPRAPRPPVARRTGQTRTELAASERPPPVPEVRLCGQRPCAGPARPHQRSRLWWGEPRPGYMPTDPEHRGQPRRECRRLQVRALTSLLPNADRHRGSAPTTSTTETATPANARGVWVKSSLLGQLLHGVGRVVLPRGNRMVCGRGKLQLLTSTVPVAGGIVAGMGLGDGRSCRQSSRPPVATRSTTAAPGRAAPGPHAWGRAVLGAVRPALRAHPI